MITTEIKNLFEQIPVMALATADNDGTPNVSAIGSKKIIDKNTIWTIDTFHQKTMDNIKQNGQVSIGFWKDLVGYQIKGFATYYSEGELFEEGKEWILEKKPNKIVKGVIEIKVSDIFHLTPDYELAGKKI